MPPQRDVADAGQLALATASPPPTVTDCAQEQVESPPSGALLEESSVEPLAKRLRRQRAPRGHAMPPVPEFKTTSMIKLTEAADIEVWDAMRGTAKTFTLRKTLRLSGQDFLAGSKVSEKTRTGGIGENMPVQVFLMVGTFSSEAEFVEKATAVEDHPLDRLGKVSDSDLRTILAQGFWLKLRFGACVARAWRVRSWHGGSLG